MLFCRLILSGLKDMIIPEERLPVTIRPSIYDFRFIVDDPALTLDLTAGIITADSVLAINTSGAFMVKVISLTF